MKKRLLYLACLILLAFNISAQVGIGTSSPATTLDVNGGVTFRETVVAIASNAASIPANVSMVQLTGVATGNITVTVPAAPNPGQRLTIFNNTTGGFAALVNSFTIPAGQSFEFIYSSSNWQSLAQPVTVGNTIIPYSSGLPVTMTSLLSGLAGTVGLVSFGSSTSGVSLLGSDINLTGGPGIASNLAFAMPRAGTIRSMSAVFSNVLALNLIATNVTITGQLYSCSTTGNLYSPVPGASVVITPNLTGIVALGTTFSGTINGLSIPVTNQTRLLLVFSINTTGLSLVNTVTGYISAGVSFD